VSREVDAKAVAREQDAHLVSGKLEAEAMPKLDMEAVANELDVVLYPWFFFASRLLNESGGFNPYFVYR
jgi:hypothetical protein